MHRAIQACHATALVNVILAGGAITGFDPTIWYPPPVCFATPDVVRLEIFGQMHTQDSRATRRVKLVRQWHRQTLLIHARTRCIRASAARELDWQATCNHGEMFGRV